MTQGPLRTTSYGQNTGLSFVDRWGMGLSHRRIKLSIERLCGKKGALLDLGCGFNAYLIRELAGVFQHAAGVDIAVSKDINQDSRVSLYEEPIEKACVRFAEGSFDVIVMNSVLEHLEDPLFVLKHCNRLLGAGGLLLVNVPTWSGKFFLETSAYVFHLSPAQEIEDHKMYYDKRDLWPLLVKAGFNPAAIDLKYHKFGLNLFGVIKKDKQR